MPEREAGLASAGDEIPHGCRVIEVRVGELRQLFNAIDPSPFRERDLDPQAEAFIVGWSRDFPAAAPLGLVVHLQRAAGPAHEAAALRDAVHEFFGQRAAATRRNLRALLRRGRVSLVIGLVCLTSSILLGDAFANYSEGGGWAEIVRESFLIGGWVAMWRPLEVFLYDWWPIRSDARLYDRLSAMLVKIVYEPAASSDTWRGDWPAAPVADRPLAGDGRR